MRHKGSAFATGGIDNFEVPSPFIGSIKVSSIVAYSSYMYLCYQSQYVKVSHDNSGLSPAWILDRFEMFLCLFLIGF
jgi:hypothetical protein